MMIFWSHWHLRRWLNKNDYELVNKRRGMRIGSLSRQLRAAQDQEYEMRRNMDELQERIYELEAEIEAHKRIETRLAERAIGHTMEETP